MQRLDKTHRDRGATLKAGLLVIAMAAMACAPSPAWAWGASSHKLIMELAYDHLTPDTRRVFNRLLAAGPRNVVEGCPLTTRDELATWPTCVRAKAPPTTPTCDDNVCALAEITRERNILWHTSLPDGERLEALAYLAYDIGEVHRPLISSAIHNGSGGDPKAASAGDAQSAPDLRGLWDDTIAEAAMAGDGRGAIAQTVGAKLRHWRVFDPTGWARETQTVAASVAAAAPAADDRAYVSAAVPAARDQLARASARLANVLETALPRAGQDKLLVVPGPRRSVRASGR